MSKRKSDNSSMDSWLNGKKAKSAASETKKVIGEWQTIGEDMFIFNPDRLEHRPKIIGFDIDSTIITTKSGKTFAMDENDWQMLFPEVPARIEEEYSNGFKIVFFTNQKGVQTGKQDPKALKRKFEAICSRINVPIQIFVSLGTLKYRKPYVGMWEYLECKENGGIEINRSESLFVGDAAGRTATQKRKKKDHSAADRLFAMNVGTRFQTPEQFFLGDKAVEPFTLPPFNPAQYLDMKKTLLEPSDAQLPSDKAEVIVLVGFPGSGKSFFAQKLEKEHGYGVVNRDTMKTWQKCVENARIFLRKGKSVVVDNTNGDAASRKRYCDLAKEQKVGCRCFVFSCDFGQATHNCKYRVIVGTDALHQDVGAMVLRMYKSKFEEPKASEGFSSVVKVNFMPEFPDKKHEDIYRMYLCET